MNRIGDSEAAGLVYTGLVPGRPKDQVTSELRWMDRLLKTNNGIAQQLGYFETVGSYQDFFAYAKALEAVTAADVKRCAEQYLKPAGRNVLVIRRKEKK